MENNCLSTRPSSRPKVIALIPSILFSFSFFFVAAEAFSQKQKDIEPIIECVKYIGNDTYVATFGYNNPNKKEVTVDENNSVVIYNKGQSKKNVINSFKTGLQSNVFTQEFNVEDRCIWRVQLPNGTIKETTASSNSSHCRNGLGLDPIFDGQAEGGVIWPELYYLAQDYEPTGEATSNEVFQITSDDKVLIEIIAIDGKYDELLKLLEEPDYGLAYIVDNGLNSLLITGYFPIANLLKLNDLGNLINFVRAVYTPIPNTGTVLSQGDSAQGSDQVREGWGLNGSDLKIGILSDSYDNLGLAADDVSNGNLPDDVVNVKDFPTQGIFFNQRDEGRAMAQIVHDIVPGADVYFHTAMISSGDFAQGIIKLVDDYQCKLIGDDITYITEPYFQDGIIAQAVNYAFSQQVYYATAAGNFGGNSYEASSVPISFNRNQFDFLPNDNSLLAHDFGGGVIMQSLSLMPGRYLIKFEWDEPFYTLRQLSGALTDYDIWIVSDDNQLLYTGRRDNIGEDPQEYLAFSVPGDQAFPVNFLITAPNMPSGQKLKYTVFVKPVAGFTWNNQSQAGINAGTIVGQANAAGAVTIGAALYTNTPPYGGTPTIASFSSRGGVQVKNQSGTFEDRQKPDFVGPNGVNTSVFLGEVFNPDGNVFNIDGDDDPNFFGTSASAPHNLGIAAQIIEGGKKFFDADWSPAEVKLRMAAQAIDMGTAGYDIESGYGYVQADAVLQDLANPKPILNDIYTTQEVIAGEVYTNIDLFADGNYFTDESVILLRGEPIPTEFVSNSQLSATIELSGDPEISVSTPSKEGTIPNSNGGTSEVLKLFDIEKTTITIISDAKSKYYLEELPDYTITVTVDPPGDDNSYVSETILSELGLDISYDAPATRYSNARPDWKIRPYFTVEPEVGLTELYDFVFPSVDEQGRLNILPLDIKIKPDDIPGLPYGEIIPEISAQIEVLTPGVTIPEDILAEVLAEYERNFSPEADYVLSNASRSLANASRSLANASRSLANNSAWIISNTSITNQARSLANQARSLANASRSLANGNDVIDVDTQLIEGYAESPGGTKLIPNAARSLANAARGLANMAFIASGDANITNAARSLANASRSLANSESFNAESNAEVVLIFDKDNLEGLSEEDYQNGYEPITNIFAIHLITGLATTSDEENDEVSNSCWILPGAYISNGVPVETAEGTDIRYSASNFRFTYGQGLIYIDPAPLTVTAHDATKIYGTADPAPEDYTFTISEDFPLVLDDDESVFSGTLERAAGEDVTEEGSSYMITEGSLNAGENYVLTVIPGNFTITPASLTVTAGSFEKVYGDDDPPLTFTYSALANDDLEENVFSGSLLRIAGEDVSLSPYTVNQGSLIATSNYMLTFVSGSLTITPASLTVSADNVIKVYRSEDPELTYQITGGALLREGDGISGALMRAVGEDVIGSPYTISNNTLTAGDNYTLSVIPGEFTIIPASLHVTADNITKVYGSEDPELTYQITGGTLLSEGDGISGALMRAVGEDVIGSPYTISNNTLTAGDNYTLTVIPGEFTIAPASLTVTADSFEKVYGSEDPGLTYQITGGVLLREGDAISGVLMRAVGEDVIGSPYTISNNTLTAGDNYTLTVIPGEFMITPASLTVYADSFEKVFGEDDPPLTFTYSALANDDLEENVFSGSLLRIAGEDVSSSPYQINQGSLSATYNYALTFEPGFLTITPAPLYVTATQIAIFSEGDTDLNSVFEFSFDPVGASLEFGMNGPDIIVQGYQVPSTIPAGEYSILYNSLLQNHEIVQPVLGTLYVNPFGPSTPNAHPRLDCIEETPEGSEYPYVAHMYYENPNPTTLFIPKESPENRIFYESGIGNFTAVNQPEYFYNGAHSFDIYFDGSKLIWSLTSYKTELTAAISSDASAGSNRCSDSGARLASNQTERLTKTAFDIENISGYPNPASNMFFVNLDEDLISRGEFKLVDMNGKIHQAQIFRNHSRNRLEIDLYQMNSGMYLLKLDFDDNNKIIKVIKR